MSTDDKPSSGSDPAPSAEDARPPSSGDGGAGGADRGLDDVVQRLRRRAAELRDQSDASPSSAPATAPSPTDATNPALRTPTAEDPVPERPDPESPAPGDPDPDDPDPGEPDPDDPGPGDPDPGPDGSTSTNAARVPDDPFEVHEAGPRGVGSDDDDVFADFRRTSAGRLVDPFDLDEDDHGRRLPARSAAAAGADLGPDRSSGPSSGTGPADPNGSSDTDALVTAVDDGTDWDDTHRIESITPTRNWTPLVVAVGAVLVVALAATAVALLLTDARDDVRSPSAATPLDTESILTEDLPTLEDLTDDIVAPAPDTGLVVTDEGVTIVEDRFDPERREGTFAAVVDNPHDDWLAQGVTVEVTFIDEGGLPAGTDTAFVEVVLPGQTVAVASLFFDAPLVPVTDVAVTVDVARWRRTEPIDGGFTTTEVETTEAEFSGVRTSFVLRSSFGEPLNDVNVTAVYRDAEGRIIGGFDTFVERLDPATDTPADIALLANISVDQVATTELYPSAAFGFSVGDT